MKGPMRFNKGKPQFSMFPFKWLTGVTRLFEVGAIKYKRGNYRTPVDSLETLVHTVEDSFFRHAIDCQDALEELLKTGDREAFTQAITDPENGLDYFNHIIWNAIVLRQQLVNLGLLKEDPGRPWLSISGWDEKVKEWEKLKEGIK